MLKISNSKHKEIDVRTPGFDWNEHTQKFSDSEGMPRKSSESEKETFPLIITQGWRNSNAHFEQLYQQTQSKQLKSNPTFYETC